MIKKTPTPLNGACKRADNTYAFAPEQHRFAPQCRARASNADASARKIKTSKNPYGICILSLFANSNPISGAR
jgi:hypothetical protein